MVGEKWLENADFLWFFSHLLEMCALSHVERQGKIGNSVITRHVSPGQTIYIFTNEKD